LAGKLAGEFSFFITLEAVVTVVVVIVVLENLAVAVTIVVELIVMNAGV